jgi:hypothetical protein
MLVVRDRLGAGLSLRTCRSLPGYANAVHKDGGPDHGAADSALPGAALRLPVSAPDWPETAKPRAAETACRPRGRTGPSITTRFYQDVPTSLAAEALERMRRQPEIRMGEPSPFKAWPDVPTRVIPCRDDRLFPASLLRRIGRERLGITPEEIEGGHTFALGRSKELAARLLAPAGEPAIADALVQCARAPHAVGNVNKDAGPTLRQGEYGDAHGRG